MTLTKGDEIVIAHAPECPASKIGFRPIEGVNQCTCDFGQRLRLYLLETFPDAYEQRADGSVGLRGEDS